MYSLFLLKLVTSEVKIHHPTELQREFLNDFSLDHIPSSLANFGNPPYGTQFIGKLYYSENEDDDLACSRLRDIDFDQDDQVYHPILIVDRGSCSFVIKVRHAQDVGAQAVIIVDSVQEDVTKIIMADDGTGGNIVIPSFLVGRSHGLWLQQKLKDPKYTNQITLRLKYEMNNPDNRVEFELWTSSDNKSVRSFLIQFAPVIQIFNDDKVLFTPHYFLTHCSECSMNNYQEENEHCLGGGKYCSMNPRFDLEGRGRLVVQEDLRQICVYKQTLDQNNEKLWWEYVRHFYSDCDDQHLTKQCSENSMQRAGVNRSKVQECINDSFEGPNHLIDDNSLLRDETMEMIRKGVFFYPSIIINNQTYRGDLEVEEVMQAICAGFKDTPDECNEYFNKVIIDPVEKTGKDKETIPVWGFILIIVVAVLILTAVLYVYKLWIKKELNNEMRMQVNSAVSQYFALSDQSN